MEQAASVPVEVAVPAWSGIPTYLGPDDRIAVIPLHISDARTVRLDDYEHVDYYESLDGEVEYHVYHRKLRA